MEDWLKDTTMFKCDYKILMLEGAFNVRSQDRMCLSYTVERNEDSFIPQGFEFKLC